MINWKAVIGAVALALGTVGIVILISFAAVAYVAPLFGLDPNACTVVVES